MSANKQLVAAAISGAMALGLAMATHFSSGCG